MKTLSCTMERKSRPPGSGEASAPEDWVAALKRSDDPGKRSDLLDDYLRTGFGHSESGFRLDLIANPYAIVATGRYGRREVGGRPEAGILFIFKDTIPEGAEGLIRDIVYPLWDRGVIVRHSTRTLGDCLTDAGRDFGVLATLLESRFVCGVSTLYSRLMGGLREKIVFKRKREILSFLLVRDRERHQRFGRPENGPEPDLVRGPGGLADVQSMMTAARVQAGLILPDELKTLGLVSDDEYRALAAAVAFIRKILAGLDRDSAGSTGILTLDRQHRAARFMGYGPGIDRFLTDLERHRDCIGRVYSHFFLDLAPDLVMGHPVQTGPSKTGRKWVNVTRGMISVTSSVKLVRHPDLIPALFRESLNTGAPLSPETRRLIEAFGAGAAASLVPDPVFCAAFESLLFDSPAHSDVPVMMLETGFLAAVLPMFDGVRHRRSFGHREPWPLCRRHLVAVDRLKVLIETHGRRANVVSDEHRRPWLWAALVHGLDGDKADERTIAKRLGPFGEDQALVLGVRDLIVHHRTIIRFVTEEDVTDRGRLGAFVRSLAISSAPDLTGACYLARAVLESRGGRALDFILADLEWFHERSLEILSGFIPSSSTDGIFRAPDSLETLKGLDRGKRRGPSVHVLEYKNTRTVTLIGPPGETMLCGVLALFARHAMAVYDLRVIDGDDADDRVFLVVRVTPPRDRMFEIRAWEAFEKDLARVFKDGPGEEDDGGGIGPESSWRRRLINVDRPPGSSSTHISVRGAGHAGDLFRSIRAVSAVGGRIRFVRHIDQPADEALVFAVQTDRGDALDSGDIGRLKEVLNDM
jgi:hypothetical protein